MKISEATNATGLSSRAIRLYESKGLLNCVRRCDNDYRDYTPADIDRLKEIARLRAAGISLADIRLYYEGILSMNELLQKRKSELKNEAKTSDKQAKQLLALISCPGKDAFLAFDEPEAEGESGIPDGDAISLGIDIGTTTISATVLGKDGFAESYCLPNTYNISNGDVRFKEQDADGIAEKAEKLVHYLLKRHPEIKAIGVTGQMHGLVYFDKNGNAVSSLATWQDGRGDISDNGESACVRVQRITGYASHTGYGIVTHVYNALHNAVPQNAVCFATIGDYIVMRLTKMQKPLIHPSNAHSLGLFSLHTNSFDFAATRALQIPDSFLPAVSKGEEIAGYCQGIPVVVALGDSQSAFLGAVKNSNNTVLVNYGTGSQVLAVVDGIINVPNGIEVRPHLNGTYLLSGAALCGGRAYAALERFFAGYLASAGIDARPQYEIMNALAMQAIEDKPALTVDTAFCGKRTDPAASGSISGITENNLTAQNIILGTLYGMAEELHAFYRDFGITRPVTVASGNAVRKNAAFCRVLANVFGTDVLIPRRKEEAAVGAALNAALTAGVITPHQLEGLYEYI